MSTLSQTISNQLTGLKVGAWSLGAVLGVAGFISYMLANRLQSKYYKAATAKLESEGFMSDDALDKIFSSIQGSANKAASPPAPKTSANGVLNADGYAQSQKTGFPQGGDGFNEYDLPFPNQYVL